MLRDKQCSVYPNSFLLYRFFHCEFSLAGALGCSVHRAPVFPSVCVQNKRASPMSAPTSPSSVETGRACIGLAELSEDVSWTIALCGTVLLLLFCPFFPLSDSCASPVSTNPSLLFPKAKRKWKNSPYDPLKRYPERRFLLC